jgi:hypothetical protein
VYNKSSDRLFGRSSFTIWLRNKMAGLRRGTAYARCHTERHCHRAVQDPLVRAVPENVPLSAQLLFFKELAVQKVPSALGSTFHLQALFKGKSGNLLELATFQLNRGRKGTRFRVWQGGSSRIVLSNCKFKWAKGLSSLNRRLQQNRPVQRKMKRHKGLGREIEARFQVPRSTLQSTLHFFVCS